MNTNKNLSMGRWSWAAFPDQEEAVRSLTSALSHTEIHCSLLSVFPSLPLPLLLSPSVLHWEHGQATTHLQVNYTLC